MMTIAGAVRCIMADRLPVISNIAPACTHIEESTSRMFHSKPEFPLPTEYVKPPE